ncbi:cytochrome c4 [Candidatus Thioglobus sp.]|jgi:cytochrome c553|uniref:c-type cytochrome n=1 Tax=Candidatus Thioglobus sp. TaxID=2026721 RepID=UPI001DD94B12|nr:cytochrome c4 [Candidatus Thioglobus sp.]MBT3276803.1 cytochrome c4 [Candidatus Thioglobus sp.]MBT3446840.1 cytochrome c4 [Candidatus Thioglobus sp.]MBT3744303.1 cytochrome c4 [Candidatus Thioglobus sp.]MBT4000828.1 cytochrome c4 [Candidatus Thioglobus sp.]MBT4181936.1 cytochrome c4 [Candidatus Thioglobus sp.]
MNKLALIFVAALAFVSTHTSAAGDAAKGKVKSATCTACHGANGNSMVPNFPKLAGQGERYLLKQLQDFKTNKRQDGLMAGIVAALTAEDMANLSAYFSKQVIAQGVTSKAANIALGEKLYRGGDKERGIVACMACHGPQGAGIPSAGFPALASQHTAYTSKQLKDFRQVSINTQTEAKTPARTNDDYKMMIEFTKDLTNAEIEALSQYISGLH